MGGGWVVRGMDKNWRIAKALGWEPCEKVQRRWEDGGKG